MATERKSANGQYILGNILMNKQVIRHTGACENTWYATYNTEQQGLFCHQSKTWYKSLNAFVKDHYENKKLKKSRGSSYNATEEVDVKVLHNLWFSFKDLYSHYDE